MLLIVQQAVSPGAGHPAAGEAEVRVPRLEAEASIDGLLDEPAWSEAARLTEFRQYQPVDGRPAEERTEVLIWYSPEAIHFAVIASDRRPETVRATVADRDEIDGDDRVTLYLDTFADRRRAFFFAVNPLGVQEDGVRTEGASAAGQLFGGSVDESPDYVWDSKGRLTEEGWVVELRVPFRSLRYTADAEQRWGLLVERKTQRTGYTDTWPAARRASASFLAQSGTLAGLRGLERGVVLEAQPFLTAAANGAVRAGGDFDRSSIEPELGANFRVGFSSISLDATVNPDFSQVEADVGQVTINERFALFFPEKRPFFLEGIELFATPNQLVYTRQVGSPVVGGKVTGKVGGLGVAHLTALDDAGAGADALFNVTRLRRDFGANSVAGVTYTDRSLVSGDEGHNRVLAADVHHVFGGLYYFEAQLGRAWTRDPAGDRSGSIWKLELDRTGRAWGFNYQVNAIGPDFVTRAGFVPRSGVVTAHAFNRFSLYGEEGAAIENFTFFVGPGRLWSHDRFGLGDAIEGREEVGTFIDLRGGWRVRSTAGRHFFVLDSLEYVGYWVHGQDEPYRPLEDVAGPRADVTVSTPAYRSFDATVTAGYGREPIFPEGAEGDVARAGAALGLRPNESVRIAIGATVERLHRARDGSLFARTVIPRLQAELQPSRSLFFRAIAEQRSERQAALVDARTGAPLLIEGEPVPAQRLDQLRVDLLASFEPSPGTVAFLGYGATLGGDRAFRLSRLQRQTDGFFLKVAYRFRR